MTRTPWSGCDDTGWSLDWELQKGSWIRCINIRVFVRRWTRWGRWCSSFSSSSSSFSYPSSYSPDVFCCWIFDFLLVGFTNYLREPWKELYSSPSGCMSKPGRRRGNRGPSNSGFNTGRCGWKKRYETWISCINKLRKDDRADFNKYTEFFMILEKWFIKEEGEGANDTFSVSFLLVI